MTTTAEPLWTIDELGTQVALALSVDYKGPPNERVREVPDLRTIRYYTTLGLLDRPAQLRGRTALYGRRHLLQLVAIKRLQADGRTLAEIQEHLVGLTNAALVRLARLPADLDQRSARRAGAARAPAKPCGADPFWKIEPAAVEPVTTAAREDHAPTGVPLWQGLSLSGEAILLLLAHRPFEEEDIEALRIA